MGVMSLIARKIYNQLGLTDMFGVLRSDLFVYSISNGKSLGSIWGHNDLEALTNYKNFFKFKKKIKRLTSEYAVDPWV